MAVLQRIASELDGVYAETASPPAQRSASHSSDASSGAPGTSHDTSSTLARHPPPPHDEPSVVTAASGLSRTHTPGGSDKDGHQQQVRSSTFTFDVMASEFRPMNAAPIDADWVIAEQGYFADSDYHQGGGGFQEHAWFQNAAPPCEQQPVPYHAFAYAEQMMMSGLAPHFADGDGVDHDRHADDGDSSNGPAPPMYTQALGHLKRIGTDLPQPAATMLNKIERKKRQRKRRVERRKENIRAKRQQQQQQQLSAQGSQNAASVSGASDSDSDSDDNFVDGTVAHDAAVSRVAPPETASDRLQRVRAPIRWADSDDESFVVSAPPVTPPATYAALVAAAPVAAAADCGDDDDDDDPDAREIPIIPAGRVDTPPCAVPLPRSVAMKLAQGGAQQAQPESALGGRRPAAAMPPTGSLPPPRSATLAAAAATVPMNNSVAREEPTSPAQAESKPSTAKQPQQPPKPAAPKVPDWHIVGGKAAAAAAAAGTSGGKSSGSPATTAGATTAASNNPFAALTAANSKKPARVDGAKTTEVDPAVAKKRAEDKKKPAEELDAVVKPKPQPAAAASVTESKPKTAAAPAKKKKAAAGDDFDAILAQLEKETAAKGPAPTDGGRRDKSRAGPQQGAPTGPDDVPAVVLLEAIAADPTPGHGAEAAATLVAALRYAESRGGYGHVRTAAIVPLERATATASVAKRVRALAHLELADCCAELQDLEQAIAHGTAAIQLAEQVGDRALAAAAWYRVGKAHENSGDARPAMLAIAQCLARIDDPAAAPRLVAHALVCYSGAADLGACHPAAANCFAVAFERATALGDKKLLAEVLAQQASSHIARGAYTAAIATLEPLFAPALAPALQRDAGTLLRCLPSLAQAYFTVGSPAWKPLLVAHAERLEAVGDTSSASTCYSLLSQLHRSALEPREALAWAEKEAKLLRAPLSQYRLCEALNAIGTCWTMLRQPHKARGHHAQELEIAKASNDSITEAKALTSKGHADLVDGDLRGALKSAMASISLLDSIAPQQRERYIVRVNCYEAEWKLLDLLEATHAALGNTALAMRVADRKHSAELLPHLDAETRPLQAVLRPSRVFERCREAGVHLVVSFSFPWNDAATACTAYVSRLQPAEDGTAAAEGPTHTAVKLEMPVAAMAVLAAEHSPFRKAVSGPLGDTVLLTHHATRELETAARSSDALRGAMTAPPLTPTGGVSDAVLDVLSAAFLAPLQAHFDALPAGSRVLVVADGLLSAVPFHALRIAAPAGGGSGTPPQHLIERFEVSTAPSLEVFVRVAARKAEPPHPSMPLVVLREPPATALDATAQLRRAARHRLACVEWDVVAETVEPFAGAFVAAAPPRSSDATRPDAATATATATGCAADPRSDPAVQRLLGGPFTPTVSLTDVVEANARHPPEQVDATALCPKAYGAGSRIGHDVSATVPAALFALGFARVVRPLHADAAATLRPNPTPSSPSATPPSTTTTTTTTTIINNPSGTNNDQQHDEQTVTDRLAFATSASRFRDWCNHHIAAGQDGWQAALYMGAF